MSQAQVDDVIRAVSAAQAKIESHFGEVISFPDILACATEVCYQRLGGVTSRAKAYGSYKLLLSPRGVTVPIIAHEWAHAELYDRLGGYSRSNKLPAWFNEGLAVAVSDEPTHSEAVWNSLVKTGVPTPQLAELITRRDWLEAVKKYGADANTNPQALKVVYATAGHEVRQWYRRVETDGLIRLIMMLNQDVPFEKAYQLVNQSQ